MIHARNGAWDRIPGNACRTFDRSDPFPSLGKTLNVRAASAGSAIPKVGNGAARVRDDRERSRAILSFQALADAFVSRIRWAG